jgi:hypothetical protein
LSIEETSQISLKESLCSDLEETIQIVSSDSTSLDKEKVDLLFSKFHSMNQKVKSSLFEQAITKCFTLVDSIDDYFRGPQYVPSVKKQIIDALPKFVYYSSYGNLDSEIYLPHVIENLKRTDLTGSAEAKTRTIRVLFEFVGLNPQEILDMGHEPANVVNQYNQVVTQVTEEDIQDAAQRKTERQALLHSAQSRLMREFRDWWKQGEYSFELNADGNHFRIFASDKLRPEPIELENRSTGLQWFLSFFLVFLVESQDAHTNTVLLLDEAGHSLHPLAQRDLAKFFASLSKNQQIIHTTQSPFLVDKNHVDRVKVVFVDASGYTVASDNLRASETNSSQERSVYAVHAALGLSVSDILLQGCFPVVVEGTSDQYYFTAIKTRLIGEKLISPQQEIVFVPSGGTGGIKPLTSLLGSKDNELPLVIIDSDIAGRAMKTNLEKGLYRGQSEKLISIADFTNIPDSEVEDLIPLSLLERSVNQLFRDVEVENFGDLYDNTKPIIDQIELFAKNHSVILEDGWKVIIARQFKQRLISNRTSVIDGNVLVIWTSLFEKILS